MTNFLEPTGSSSSEFLITENVDVPKVWPENEPSIDIFNREKNVGKEPLVIYPEEACCLKTRNEDDKKIFINVGTSEKIPIADDISEQELLKLIDSDDPALSNYRVPMSIGQPHIEKDKKDVPCTAYDVVIHPSFFTKVDSSPVFNGFFVSVVLEGLETKYDLKLSRDFVRLKNVKSLGNVEPQTVRQSSRPLIRELSSKPADDRANNENDTIVKPARAEEPKFVMIQEPPEGQPEYIIAEIELPLIKSIKSLTLDVGEDRLVLRARSGVYHLNIFLPFDIDQSATFASFDTSVCVLTVTMPVTS